MPAVSENRDGGRFNLNDSVDCSLSFIYIRETGTTKSFGIQQDGTLNNFGDAGRPAGSHRFQRDRRNLTSGDCELCDRCCRLTLFWSKCVVHKSMIGRTISHCCIVEKLGGRL